MEFDEKSLDGVLPHGIKIIPLSQMNRNMFASKSPPIIPRPLDKQKNGTLQPVLNQR